VGKTRLFVGAEALRVSERRSTGGFDEKKKKFRKVGTGGEPASFTRSLRKGKEPLPEEWRWSRKGIGGKLSSI